MDGLDPLLERLAADEELWKKLRASAEKLKAAGWALRLEAAASEALDALDPTLRSHFAEWNSLAEAAGGSIFPGAGLVIWLLLSLAEGPGLNWVESALRARRRMLEAE